jgi:hypothetical protein
VEPALLLDWQLANQLIALDPDNFPLFFSVAVCFGEHYLNGFGVPKYPAPKKKG